MKKILTLSLLILISLLSCKDNQDTATAAQPQDPTTIEEKVNDLISKMTLDEKIGQMTQVDHLALTNPQDVAKYFIGSVLSGGNSDEGGNTAVEWADLYDRMQAQALKTRLKIPIIYGIDAVHGHNNVKDATMFPHNIGLGCTRNPELVEKAARVTAEEIAATGIDWTFAPCIAVVRDERWGRTYEGFGETPELQKMMGDAQVKGFQLNFSSPTSILACSKHYMGDGGTQGGKDQGNTVCDEATLRSLFLQGYASAVKEGVGSVMASYNSWNGQKMHGNKYLLTDVLKGELGFKGFVVSDWAAIDQLPGDYKSDVINSINAGLDMIMLPDNFVNFINTLKQAVNEGSVPMTRIDDAVKRILTVKFQMNLFDKPYADRSGLTQIGSKEHREVARECVRQSLVLLKNDNKALPLSKSVKRIHVAGKSADDMGNQCGGWTISWQGTSGNVTSGTTILQAIKNSVSSNTQVTYSVDGSSAEGADIGVVVVGETPYAEGAGDKQDLSLSADDVAAINKMKSAGMPVVVILLSGRPMIINNVLDNCDAFVAAWLPGTEGEGVTDVLFGDYNFTGKLSHTWPKNMQQIPINYGDSNYDPLFPYGFGLTF